MDMNFDIQWWASQWIELTPVSFGRDKLTA